MVSVRRGSLVGPLWQGQSLDSAVTSEPQDQVCKMGVVDVSTFLRLKCRRLCEQPQGERWL